MTSSILLKKKYCLLGTQCLKSRGGRRRQEHCKLFRDFEKIAGSKSQVKSMLCSSAQHQVPQNLKLHAHAEVYTQTQCFWHRRAGGVLIFKWVQLLDKSLRYWKYSKHFRFMSYLASTNSKTWDPILFPPTVTYKSKPIWKSLTEGRYTLYVLFTHKMHPITLANYHFLMGKLFVKVNIYQKVSVPRSSVLLNSVSFSQCIVLNDLHWDWVYHCFVLRRQKTYNMKWLFSPLLDVRLHERITLWQKQAGLVTDTMICGYLSTSEGFP